MPIADALPKAVSRYRTQLDVGRDEARRWLELLSNRQLAENIARTRRELATVRDEDLSEPLAQVLGDLGARLGASPATSWKLYGPPWPRSTWR